MTGAGSPLETVGLCLLAAALAGALEQRPRAAVALLAGQGTLLTGGAVFALFDSGDIHGVLAVLLTLAVKVVAIPWVLLAAVRAVSPAPGWRLAVPKRVALLLALAVVLITFYWMEPLSLPGAGGTARVLSASVAVMLLGLYAMLIQRSALGQVMGLVTMENGLYLAALAATRGLPLAVELGVALDALVA
ncbi:MAG: hypothetical protein AAB289_11840, partial [Chloroflexota bacterium]